MAHPDVSAAIIAGGQARRFGGRDKSRLLVEGSPIIVRQVEVLQQVAHTFFIVASDTTRFADLEIPAYADLIEGAGAIGGLYTALEIADTEFVVAVACDLPFLDAGVLNRLVELARTGDGAWIRTASGVEPLLACYRRNCRLAVRREIEAGHLKLADLAAVLQMQPLDASELVEFGPPGRLLANINSPDDFARIQ